MALLFSKTAAQSDDGEGEHACKSYMYIILVCPVWYNTQPPTELKCNPMGTFLNLRCQTSSKISNI